MLQPRITLSERYFNPRGCISLDLHKQLFHSRFQYFNPRGCISLDRYGPSVQAGFHHFNPRGCISLDSMNISPSPVVNHFNPRGCISLDEEQHHLFIPLYYFNPRGCIILDSKNIQKIYSKLYPNTTIIQHLSNFITIQLQYILKFHYYLQKFGANPPANPWELTVRTN